MNNALTKESLKYLIARLLERAAESVDEYDESTGDDKLFESGRKTAYYEMLDILKNELDVREQDLNEFGLDIDLLNKIA